MCLKYFTRTDIFSAAKSKNTLFAWKFYNRHDRGPQFGRSKKSGLSYFTRKNSLVN